MGRGEQVSKRCLSPVQQKALWTSSLASRLALLPLCSSFPTSVPWRQHLPTIALRQAGSVLTSPSSHFHGI